MDIEKQNQPKGMTRDAFLESLVEIINEAYAPSFNFVKRECKKDNQNESPKNITNQSYLLSYKYHVLPKYIIT